MKCSLCGLEFREQDGVSSCKGCAVSGSCSLVKCPNCGYETPKEPGVIKFIRSLKKQKERKK